MIPKIIYNQKEWALIKDIAEYYNKSSSLIFYYIRKLGLRYIKLCRLSSQSKKLLNLGANTPSASMIRWSDLNKLIDKLERKKK